MGLAMRTRIIPLTPFPPPARVIGELVAGLLRDEVMAYPTETFYGLGAAGFSKKAVGKIFRIKGRDPSKPLPVLASDIDMVESLAGGLPRDFLILAEEFWPGPLTLVVRASPRLPGHLAGPGRTLALRVPPDAWLRELVGRLGQPLTATSANLAGREALSDPHDVIGAFSGKVEMIVDGGRTPGGAPSTIVDLTGTRPRVLRDGAVPAAEVFAALGPGPT